MVLTGAGWILATLLFVAGIVQLFIASALFVEMISLVNERMLSDRQISQIGANSRMREISRLYQSFYPEGALYSKLNRLLIGGFSCFGLAVLLALLLA